MSLGVKGAGLTEGGAGSFFKFTFNSRPEFSVRKEKKAIVCTSY